jgi:hypothetical protein
MSRLGRPPSGVVTTDWKLRIPASLATEWEFMLADPITMKPAVGARGKLLTIILDEVLHAHYSGADSIPLTKITAFLEELRRG